MSYYRDNQDNNLFDLCAISSSTTPISPMSSISSISPVSNSNDLINFKDDSINDNIDDIIKKVKSARTKDTNIITNNNINKSDTNKFDNINDLADLGV